MANLRGRIAAAALALTTALAEPAPTQETLERTTNLSGGWIGQNGFLYANLPYRFHISEEGGRHVAGTATFEFALGLPRRLLGGARFADQSPTVPGRPDEWEVFARRQSLGRARRPAGPCARRRLQWRGRQLRR